MDNVIEAIEEFAALDSASDESFPVQALSEEASDHRATDWLGATIRVARITCPMGEFFRVLYITEHATDVFNVYNGDDAKQVYGVLDAHKELHG